MAIAVSTIDQDRADASVIAIAVEADNGVLLSGHHPAVLDDERAFTVVGNVERPGIGPGRNKAITTDSIDRDSIDGVGGIEFCTDIAVGIADLAAIGNVQRAGAILADHQIAIIGPGRGIAVAVGARNGDRAIATGLMADISNASGTAVHHTAILDIQPAYGGVTNGDVASSRIALQAKRTTRNIVS